MKKVLFLLVACLAMQSCSLFEDDLRSIVENTEDATFTIYTFDEYGCPSGSGSGFFIKEDGTGVTNWHVLDKSVKAVVKTKDGLFLIDTVLKSSQKKDLVVFQLKNESKAKFKALKVSKDSARKGDVVYNIGSPVGLESSVSSGIVASFRQKGKTVQVTAPVSPGSSGSPLLDRKGNVFAVVTSKQTGGENLNFGVVIKPSFTDELDASEFASKNAKFNSSKSDLRILNIQSPSEMGLTLNAIEFTKTATTCYFTFTNVNLNYDDMYLFAETGKKDNGFFIEDKDTKERYYITSSTLPSNEKDAAEGKTIGMAGTKQFKVHFPAINKIPQTIDLREGESSSWQFKNINLAEYENIKLDEHKYLRDEVFTSAQSGDYSRSVAALAEVLDEDSQDILALNMMGVYSYLLEEYRAAETYFTEAIDANPNDALSYTNLFSVHNAMGKYEEAAQDLSTAIDLDPENLDNFYERARLYTFDLEKYSRAIDDINKCLEKEPNNADYLFVRAYANCKAGNFSSAKKDALKAYTNTNDKKLQNKLSLMWDIFQLNKF